MGSAILRKDMQKKKYKVFARRIVEIEGEDPVTWPWEFVGNTYAVSEAKAINNVRFRNEMPSQYKPIETSGHYDVFVEWKAEVEL